MISDFRATSGSDSVSGRDRTPLNRGLDLFGVAVVAFYFVTLAGGRPLVVLVPGGTAIVLWLAASLIPIRPVRLVCLGLMLVLGAATMESTDALLIAPVIAAVIALEGDERLPASVGAAAAGLAAAIDLVVAAVTRAPIGYLFGTLGGIALALLVGYSRRQTRAVARQRDELVTERLAAEREQERAALLADRARAARDVHDVLAHSLGGLVLQLDAVEALLEAGRVEDATHRAGDARQLAVDGLAEARRAVATLRDKGDEPRSGAELHPGAASGPVRPAPPAGAPDVAHPATLPELVEAHRSFGGAVSVVGDPTLSTIDEHHRGTVVAAAREALSNARKHAAGAPVTITVETAHDTSGGPPVVHVVIANPVRAAGHGLVGIRERFAELGDGSTVEFTATGATFAVSMRVPTAGGRQ